MTSSITVEEYCVFPYSRNEINLIEKFYAFFQDMGIRIIEVAQKIADRAARIRAKYQSFRAMDALQLATARIQNCQLFLTNDKQLKQFQERTCMILEESILEKI